MSKLFMGLLKHLGIIRMIGVLGLESRVWAPLFTAIAAMVATYLAYLKIISTASSLIVASSFAAIMLFSFDFAAARFLNNLTFRRAVDKRAKFEGVWFEYQFIKQQGFDNAIKANFNITSEANTDILNGTSEDNILYSVFSIKYTGLKDEPFIIKGDTYHSNGKKFSEWRSARIKFDVIENTLVYFYTGLLIENQDLVVGFAQFSFNVSSGYLEVKNSDGQVGSTFSTRSDKTLPHSGFGYLIEHSCGGPVKKDFDFFRVTDDIMERVLGDLSLKNFEVEREFVRRFDDKYGKHLKEKGFFSFRDASNQVEAVSSTIK